MSQRNCFHNASLQILNLCYEKLFKKGAKSLKNRCRCHKPALKLFPLLRLFLLKIEPYERQLIRNLRRRICDIWYWLTAPGIPVSCVKFIVPLIAVTHQLPRILLNFVGVSFLSFFFFFFFFFSLFFVVPFSLFFFFFFFFFFFLKKKKKTVGVLFFFF